MAVRPIRIMALIVVLVLGSEIASVGGMLLIVKDGGEDGLRTPVQTENDWREAHINGAQRLRTIGPFVLPLLLLTAAVLSFIAPEENETAEDFWDDDFSF